MATKMNLPKQFSQFLKFVTVSGINRQAVIEFNTDEIVSNVINMEETMISNVKLGESLGLKEPLVFGVSDLQKLSNSMSALGEDVNAIVDSNISNLVLSSDRGKYKLLLASPNIIDPPDDDSDDNINDIAGGRRSNFFNPDGFDYIAKFTLTESDIDSILRGMSVIDSEIFYLKLGKDNSSFRIGTENTDQFSFNIDVKVEEEKTCYYQKDNVRNMMTLMKGNSVKIFVENEFILFEFSDAENNISARYFHTVKMDDTY